MTDKKYMREIIDKYVEIVERINNGSLDSTVVTREFQSIIDTKSNVCSWVPPRWWTCPEQQLECAHKLWPGRQLPKPPDNFIARTETEVLLLHVPASFNTLWGMVRSPGGYDTISRVNFLGLNQRNIRLASRDHAYVHPVWLRFDPAHGKGMSPSSFVGRSDMAAGEVLSALIQFPGWPATWRYGDSGFLLAGYQAKVGDSWLHTPAITLGKEGLTLQCFSASVSRRGMSVPTAQLC